MTAFGLREGLCRLYRVLDRPRPIDDWYHHLDCAADWIARAQDAGTDDGVAAYYDIASTRWAASYPETTGYIIPTFYTYARCRQRPEFADRATRMARWECQVQLASGAVRAGFMDAEPVVPTVFNTGQVLFGWAAAYRETGEPCFGQALRAAADWLLSVQDTDGAWRRFGSPFASHAVNTYNTRSALGLFEAADALDEPRYRQAGLANAHWALGRDIGNGWLSDNDLEDNRRPLTHTLGYAIQALLEIGLRAGDARCIETARMGLSRLGEAQRDDGSLPGRLDRHWQAAAAWSGLTGDVQIAQAWLQLAVHDDDARWTAAARRAVAFVASHQDLWSPNPAVNGAIAGSYPRFGGYMTGRYPNWAAKFFMDALMALIDGPDKS